MKTAILLSLASVAAWYAVYADTMQGLSRAFEPLIRALQ